MLLSLSAAAFAAGLAGSAIAAPTTHARKTASSKTSHASHLSKWQRYQQSLMRRSAPGDEYFGRMKMSYLGINNTYHDEMIRAGAYTVDPSIISHVRFAEEAMQAWAHKYPHDPQLARSYFLASEVNLKIYTQPTQHQADVYLHEIVARWPKSYFGKSVRASLARGFTEHYFAAAQPCPSPAPPRAPAQKTGAALSPAPTPYVAPSPAPRPGQPKVVLLPSPCYAPSP